MIRKRQGEPWFPLLLCACGAQPHRSPGAHCAPLRRAERRVPVEWNPPFLLFLANGRRKVWCYAPCARSAPLFPAANAANLRAETYEPAPAQRNRGDSQEGRNFVPPLLCACGAQPRICRYDLAYTARRGRESGQFAAPMSRPRPASLAAVQQFSISILSKLLDFRQALDRIVWYRLYRTKGYGTDFFPGGFLL